MAHASIRGVRPGRMLALAVGLLALPVLAASARAADDPKPVAAASNTAEMVQFINEQLRESWKANNLTPSRPADDYEFIRRATLDIIGRIATTEEIDHYLKDPKETRRAQLIERLLKHEDYPGNWANVWANWLLTRSSVFGRGDYREQTVVWLEDQFAQNKPHDKLVVELITASGKNSDSGAVNFILAHVGEAMPRGSSPTESGQFDMVPITSRITRLFLATQTQCAQCHDHPFDKSVKQQDFWGINAFLRQVQRNGTPPLLDGQRMMGKPPTLELVFNSGYNSDGLVDYEKRSGVFLKAKPTFLGGVKLEPDRFNQDRRAELARLVVEHDKFPKAYVNRLWAHFFGKGIVNPIDDFNDQNTPSHPALLKELAAKFKHYGYNQKDLIRWICNSEAYQLSSIANKTNDASKPETEPLFSRMALRPLSPEELFESLMEATQAEAAQAKDRKKELRATWLDKLVANFGDDEGNEVNYTGTVVQALLMMNGSDLNQAVSPSDPTKGTVAKALAKKGASQQTIITDLYLATLNRKPTADEYTRISRALPLLTKTGQAVPEKEMAHRYQDLLWALVNSNEFMLNH